MPRQYSVEITAQVYLNTQEGMIPVSGSQTPRNLAIAIAMALQRAMIALHPCGDNISITIDTTEEDTNGDESQ